MRSMPQKVKTQDKTGQIESASYAKGMTVRDVQEQVSELYATEISRELISLTDNILEDVTNWRNRALMVTNRCVYMIYGINIEGKKDQACIQGKMKGQNFGFIF